MRVCHNVTESVNNAPHRQRISYSESTSLLVKIHCEEEIPLKQRLVKNNFIKAKAYKG